MNWHGWPPQIWEGEKWVYLFKDETENITKENTKMNTPQLPDYLKNRPFEAVSDALDRSLGAGAPPVLSIEGDRFTLVDAGGNQQPLSTVEQGVPYADAVVIHTLPHYSKIYYGSHKYNPNEGSPPVCFSDNGVAPSRNSSEPQSPTCASCQWSAWGSATSEMTGKGVKACKDYQKIALLVTGFDGVYLLRVPPNSLTAFREYNARFKGSGTDIADVVTRISFERGVRGTLTFKGVSYIDQAIAQIRNDARAKKVTDNLIGLNDVPVSGMLAGPQPAQAQVVMQSQGIQPPPFVPAPFAGAPSTGMSAMAPTPTPPTSGTPVGVAAPPSSGRKRGRPRATP